MKPKKPKPTKAAKIATGAARFPFPIKSILVPLDFSSPSRQTLAYAATFARQFKAKLTLLHVIEPITTPGFAPSFALALEDDKLVAAARREVEIAATAARVPRRIVEKILVRCGRSFHEIAEAARTRKVDLIILATHGYTGLKHALLGSTTERVVRHAPCAVLVVRQR